MKVATLLILAGLMVAIQPSIQQQRDDEDVAALVMFGLFSVGALYVVSDFVKNICDNDVKEFVDRFCTNASDQGPATPDFPDKCRACLVISDEDDCDGDCEWHSNAGLCYVGP